MAQTPLMKEFNEAVDPSQRDNDKLYNVACDFFRENEALKNEYLPKANCPHCQTLTETNKYSDLMYDGNNGTDVLFRYCPNDDCQRGGGYLSVEIY